MPQKSGYYAGFDDFEDLIDYLPPDLSEPPDSIGFDIPDDVDDETAQEYRETLQQFEELFEALFERKDPQPDHAAPFTLTEMGVVVIEEAFEKKHESALEWINSLISDDGPLQWHGVPGNVRVWSVGIGFKRELGVNILRFINKQFYRVDWLEAPIPKPFVKKLDECPGPGS